MVPSARASRPPERGIGGAAVTQEKWRCRAAALQCARDCGTTPPRTRAGPGANLPFRKFQFFLPGNCSRKSHNCDVIMVVSNDDKLPMREVDFQVGGVAALTLLVNGTLTPFILDAVA